MGMRVISFETFESNDEFEQWQKDYFAANQRTPMITQVAPLINSMEGAVSDEHGRDEIRMFINCGCFCLYMTEHEPPSN